MDFSLSPDQCNLSQQIYSNLRNNGGIAWEAMTLCGLDLSDKQHTPNFIPATVYFYDQGLRGHSLRKKVRHECGISVLLVLQLILIIPKINTFT